MEATKANPYLSESGRDAVLTRVERETSASRALVMACLREVWQSVLDRTLGHWLNNPDMFEDDEIEGPSGTTIRLAFDCAETLMDHGLAPPSSIVPDGNGGIVFEQRQGREADVVHIWDDGTVEFQQFDGSRLVCRKPFNLGAF